MRYIVASLMLFSLLGFSSAAEAQGGTEVHLSGEDIQDIMDPEVTWPRSEAEDRATLETAAYWFRNRDRIEEVVRERANRQATYYAGAGSILIIAGNAYRMGGRNRVAVPLISVGVAAMMKPFIWKYKGAEVTPSGSGFTVRW